MFLQDCRSTDPGLKIALNEKWPEEILAICALDSLSQNGLIFIKNAKFFQKLAPHIERAATLKIGAVIDEALYQGLNEDSRAQLHTLAWIATSPQVSLSLTLLSKPFYHQKLRGLNSQVDGRQMGNVEIDPSAFVAQNVFIGEHVKIGPGVEIMPGTVILPHVEIAEGSKIYPNVSIYPFTKIGRNCRIHSGTVIGADGFGYTFHQGKHLKIWHTGGVVIEDDVEIGANSAVDCGTFSPTFIGSGTRIDNFVQIAHNCRIGRGCVICGHAALAGSAVLEDFVVLAGKVGIGPDTHLGKGTQVAGAAMVTDGAIWPAGSKLGGHPARELKEWLRGLAYVRKMSLKEKSS
ncbi:MAG TPA: UDP-3-O-(3-hydroxymyristoyl)glucosamine N-acyltransferase [Bacteriovoracaceae bacterium]|nr:UDP-3-O-(3-hydroxymyristoyl)glucosamine N-acyltransferase [Bacteriovoracaceae bacterium]